MGTGPLWREVIGWPQLFTARHVGFFKPVITAVNGISAGAGLHIVADSNIVIAIDKASFVDTHVNVGRVTALEPIGLSKKIPLERLLRMVVLSDELMTRAMELAGLAAKHRRKRCRSLSRRFGAVWTTVWRYGWKLLTEHRTHSDAVEGPRAFAEKRDPDWTS